MSLHQMGRHALARASFAQAVRIRTTALGVAHPLTVNSQARLGQCEIDLGLFDEAARSLDAAQHVLDADTHQNAKLRQQVQEQRARLTRARPPGNGR
jgi:hypothetical protein